MEALSAPPAETKPAQDLGIDILVDLAKRGEIDPWDVDIVTLTDKYLNELDRRAHRSLPLSGKAIFYGCVLLNIKARHVFDEHSPLARDQEAADELTESYDEGYDEIGGEVPGGPSSRLDWANILTTSDGVILVPRGRQRTRKLTLDDLIRALRRCDAEEQRRVSEGMKPTSEFFLGTTHQEDLATDVELLKGVLEQHLRFRQKVSFDSVTNGKMKRVNAWMALLHMASQSQVVLEQDEFYKDLNIAWRA